MEILIWRSLQKRRQENAAQIESDVLAQIESRLTPMVLLLVVGVGLVLFSERLSMVSRTLVSELVDANFDGVVSRGWQLVLLA